MEEDMKYEMRIPAGVTRQIMANVMDKFDVEAKQTDYGPVLCADKKTLEDVRDFIVKALNERIRELEKRD